MFFRLDKENKIIDCSEEKYADDCLFTNDKIERDFTGQLVFATDKQTDEYKKAFLEFKENQKKDRLRIKRKEECFEIINRGKLWYDTLSEEQIAELRNWYKSWLDITQSKTEPKKPEFLCDNIEK